MAKLKELLNRLSLNKLFISFKDSKPYTVEELINNLSEKESDLECEMEYISGTCNVRIFNDNEDLFLSIGELNDFF